MTLRRFTDRDRQDLRDAQEERRVLDEPARTYATEAWVEVTAEQIRLSDNLRTDPYRRSGRGRRQHHARLAPPTVAMSLKPLQRTARRWARTAPRPQQQPTAAGAPGRGLPSVRAVTLDRARSGAE